MTFKRVWEIQSFVKMWFLAEGWISEMQCLIKEVFFYVHEGLIRQKAVKEGVTVSSMVTEHTKENITPA